MSQFVGSIRIRRDTPTARSLANGERKELRNVGVSLRRPRKVSNNLERLALLAPLLQNPCARQRHVSRFGRITEWLLDKENLRLSRTFTRSCEDKQQQNPHRTIPYLLETVVTPLFVVTPKTPLIFVASVMFLFPLHALVNSSASMEPSRTEYAAAMRALC